MITRENYEEHFLDYFEGRLSDKEIEGLLRFLAANPDLEEEFYLLMEQTASCPITDEDFLTVSLKRDENTEYSLSSFEYFCVANLEKDITPSEKQILDSAIASNPKLKKDFDDFLKTKVPAENIVCPFKDELKKNVFSNHTKRNAIAYTSIAAAVLVVFYFSFNFDENGQQISSVTPTSTTANQPKIDKAIESSSTIIEKKTVQIAAVTNAEHRNDVKRNNHSIINSISTNENPIITHVEEGNASLKSTDIAYIEPQRMATIEARHNLSINAENKTEQSSAIQVDNEKDLALAHVVNSVFDKAKEEAQTLKSQVNSINGKRKGIFFAHIVNGVNYLLGTNIEYSSKYDAEGKLVAMDLRAGSYKYSKKGDETK